jgi:hypothetical protein
MGEKTENVNWSGGTFEEDREREGPRQNNTGQRKREKETRQDELRQDAKDSREGKGITKTNTRHKKASQR